MADIEKLKKLMVFVRDQMCHKTDCIKCDYNNPDGICYSISDIMRDALSVIEQMEQERRWIPVSERLPDERINPLTHDFDTVICLCEFSKATDVRMYAFKDGHFYCGHMVMDEYITHWMYKPQPPKEGEQDG